MKLNWDKIIFVVGIIGICGSVFGIFGGIFFESIKIMIIGLLVWAVVLIIILLKALDNYLF